jgi:DNA-binding NtrC family response regulator
MMQERIDTVPESTVLVISRNDALVDELKSVSGRVCAVDFVVCDSVHKALAMLEKGSPRAEVNAGSLILVDQEVAEDRGAVLRLLRSLAARPALPVVILSPRYRLEDARLFLRAGAADYLSRPLDHGKLACLMDLLVTRACLAASSASPPPPLAGVLRPEGFRPASLGPDVMDALEQLRRVVPQETTVLLMGEPGTGKKWLARLIHDLSPRRDEPLVVANCSAPAGLLMESALFGHVKGAFPGAESDRAGLLAQADKGTLVLDDVSALPLPLQSRLLHALEQRSFDPIGSDVGQPLQARLMATTSVPLEDAVAAGRFRSELFYRLNIVSFSLPSLRERRTAIAPLAHRLLEEFAARHRPDIPGLATDAAVAIEAYAWPGNVRQLRRVIEHAAAICTGPEIQLTDLPESIRAPLPRPPLEARGPGRFALPAGRAGTLAQSKAEAELLRITQALRRHDNNRVRAAAELGISRMSLYKKLQKYGLLTLTRT